MFPVFRSSIHRENAHPDVIKLQFSDGLIRIVMDLQQRRLKKNLHKAFICKMFIVDIVLCN